MRRNRPLSQLKRALRDVQTRLQKNDIETRPKRIKPMRTRHVQSGLQLERLGAQHDLDHRRVAIHVHGVQRRGKGCQSIFDASMENAVEPLLQTAYKRIYIDIVVLRQRIDQSLQRAKYAAYRFIHIITRVQLLEQSLDLLVNAARDVRGLRLVLDHSSYKRIDDFGLWIVLHRKTIQKSLPLARPYVLQLRTHMQLRFGQQTRHERMRRHLSMNLVERMQSTVDGHGKRRYALRVLRKARQSLRHDYAAHRQCMCFVG